MVEKGIVNEFRVPWRECRYPSYTLPSVGWWALAMEQGKKNSWGDRGREIKQGWFRVRLKVYTFNRKDTQEDWGADSGWGGRGLGDGGGTYGGHSNSPGDTALTRKGKN
jgi:hypothetical protein